MSYDLYIAQPQDDEATQLRLLVTQSPEQALSQYLSLIHGKLNKQKRLERGAFNGFIARQLQQLQNLDLNEPQLRDFHFLPPGSWFLQFTFTLAKPWMSKDDDPFYVTESVNPVRKDKVFKVPMMSASAWKGLLRWTAMHVRLAQEKDTLTPEQFALERFRQVLLFGDEKGEEPGQTKDLAAYLDALKPEARTEYERLLCDHYHIKADEPLPHHRGRLSFYPTFFNLIDVEVINPHSRYTKAGTHPIYLECVPAGAKGTFSLLYIPLDLIGREEVKIFQDTVMDLHFVIESIYDMFLTYGFSAKKTSGYGVAQNHLEDYLLLIRLEKIKVSFLRGEIQHEKAGKQFFGQKISTFDELKQLIYELKDKI